MSLRMASSMREVRSSTDETNVSSRSLHASLAARNFSSCQQQGWDVSEAKPRRRQRKGWQRVSMNRTGVPRRVCPWWNRILGSREVCGSLTSSGCHSCYSCHSGCAGCSSYSCCSCYSCYSGSGLSRRPRRSSRPLHIVTHRYTPLYTVTYRYTQVAASPARAHRYT